MARRSSGLSASSFPTAKNSLSTAAEPLASVPEPAKKMSARMLGDSELEADLSGAISQKAVLDDRPKC
jgi:hypothetical protein